MNEELICSKCHPWSPTTANSHTSYWCGKHVEERKKLREEECKRITDQVYKELPHKKAPQDFKGIYKIDAGWWELY